MHGDPNLKGVTHVIVDEVHERNVDTDFLLAILELWSIVRKYSQVVLMSATMDAQLFVRYFESPYVPATTKNAGPISKLSSPPPVISVPGFVYPVENILRRHFGKVGLCATGCKGWRNAGDTGGDDNVTSAGQEEGSDAAIAMMMVRSQTHKTTAVNLCDHMSWVGRTDSTVLCLESLQKLSHGSHANSWEKKGSCNAAADRSTSLQPHDPC